MVFNHRIFYSNLTNALANFFAAKNIFTYNFNDYPFRPSVFEFATKQVKGCQFYSKLLKYDPLKRDNINFRHSKWEAAMNLQPDYINWNYVYQFNLKIKFDMKTRFFHYLIIRMGLLTKLQSSNFLHDDNSCTFCSMHPETVLHLLYECDFAVNLRNNIRSNISPIYNYDVTYLDNPMMFLLGMFLNSPDNLTFFINITTARFIWICKHKDQNPNFEGLKGYLKYFISYQKFADKLNCIRNVDVEALWR